MQSLKKSFLIDPSVYSCSFRGEWLLSTDKGWQSHAQLNASKINSRYWYHFHIQYNLCLYVVGNTNEGGSDWKRQLHIPPFTAFDNASKAHVFLQGRRKRGGRGGQSRPTFYKAWHLNLACAPEGDAAHDNRTSNLYKNGSKIFSALRTEVTFDRLNSAFIMQDRNHQYSWSSLIHA